VEKFRATKDRLGFEIGVGQISTFSTTTMHPGQRLPLVVSPTQPPESLAEFSLSHNSQIAAWLVEHGAVLFRGYNVRGTIDFDEFARSISDDRLKYIYRSTPRTLVANNLLTASEYPPSQEIPLHTENSYQSEWPRKVAFYCSVPATSGGETPLADMKRVSAVIGEETLGEFEARKVQYVRHYHPYIDVPWSIVFQTDDKEAVADYCDRHAIDHEWLDAETLRTAHVCQGAIVHPQTKVRTFFNQAHLFHYSSLGPEASREMIDVFGRDRLPRNAFYGDGGDFGSETLERIRSAFRSESVEFQWQAGDVLLLDNMQVAHGRRSFIGKREVFAVLLERYQHMTAQ